MQKPLRNNSADLERLYEIISHRRMDYEFEKEGGKILYAVDSDIIKLFSNPEERAVDKGARFGYTQLFGDSNKVLAKDLAVSLSHYIFYSLTKDVPLLMFEAQIKEVRNIYHGVLKNIGRNNFSDASISKTLDSVLELAQLIDTNNIDTNESEKKLEEEFEISSEKIIKSLEYGSEIDRLNNLTPKNKPRFASVFYLLKNYSDIFKEKYFNSDQSLYESSLIRTVLNKKLKKINPSQKAALRENDVSALHNLYFINKNFEKLNIKYRLVLISGDEKIYHASKVLNIAEDNSNNIFDFRKLYLRHPLSFINDNDFIGEIDYESFQDEVDIKDFTDIASLFENLYLKKSLPVEDLEHRTNTLPSILDKFLEKKLIKYSMLLEDYKNRTINKLVREIRDTKSGNRYLKKLSNKASNILINKTTMLSLNLHRDFLETTNQDESYCYRIPPFLRFERITEAEDYVKSWSFHEKVGEDRDDVELLLERVQEKDPSDYTLTLCHSALWADIDEWDLVEDNAGRAFKIAIDLSEHETEQNNIYLGHEASYLSHVSARHVVNAKTRKELDRILSYLDVLMVFTTKQWDKFREKESHIEKASEEFRFRHEILSSKLMKIWYELFYFDYIEMKKNEISLLENELQSINNQLLEIINQTIDKLKTKKKKKNVDYLRYVQRHAINNYCMTYIILDRHDAFKSNTSKSNIEEIREILNLYETTTNKKKSSFKVKSYLHACTMNTATILYSEISKNVKANLMQKMYCLLTDDEIDRYSRKPYEKERYRFYLDILGM